MPIYKKKELHTRKYDTWKIETSLKIYYNNSTPTW